MNTFSNSSFFQAVWTVARDLWARWVAESSNNAARRSAATPPAANKSGARLEARQRGLALFVGILFSSLGISSGLRAAESSRAPAAVAADGSRIVIETPRPPAPAPVFFSATAEQVVRLTATEITSEIRLQVRVVQGRVETLTLGLAGEGEVVDVSGNGLRDWSVRQGAGVGGRERFLDLRPVLPPTASTSEQGGRSSAPPLAPLTLDLVVRTRSAPLEIPATARLLLITPGEAIGFTARVTLQPDPSVDLRVTEATGMMSLPETAGTARVNLQFLTTGTGRLQVSLAQRGAGRIEAELVGAQLAGRVDATAASVEFRLRGQVRSLKAGARLRLLSGRAALNEKTAGDGWHIELVAVSPGRFAYELVAEREGALPLDLTFAAGVREDGEWRVLDFMMPAGAVVPLQLAGLDARVSFKSDATVVPTPVAGAAPAPAAGWQGFLPASGAVVLAWKQARPEAEGTLAFTSSEQTEVRLSAGLLKQSAHLTFRILQGKLPGVRVRLDGPGEIVGVEGANIIGWKVLPAEGGRVLEVQLSRPLESEGSLVVHSQTELGTWPARAAPLRLSPEGGVRHAGIVRIANRGAVRLEVTDVTGMMQLAPEQFAGAPLETDARQVFVFRFPSAAYGYQLVATQIQPEIAVAAIATYELGDTARVIQASVELDVREAPLRDWSLRIPEDYDVVSLTGSDVADYVAETGVVDGYRQVRVLFARPIEGRQLLQLRLEQDQAAAAGEWSLRPLQFPNAKTVRGHVGVIATPGYRLVPTRVEQLVEVPLAYFPQQAPGLQQAWRLRDAAWAADLRVEALGQVIHADVFHLHTLREGLVASSVLLNYFVIGAPASEWRIEVPVGVGNIDVVGQNVRRDWRREGDQLIVSLHQPVLGAATLLVTFEQPMSARGGAVAAGQARPLGVQSERGYIQVVSPRQVKHALRTVEGGLLKLEAAELPAEFRPFTSAPSLAVYHYTARPFTLALDIEWYAEGELVDQVVDFAQLTTQVSRDGQVVTEAQLFVKTRGRQALRLLLPPGAKLWEARVDREVVHARADGEHTLVPLPARLNPNDPVTVALRIGQPADGAGSSVTFTAPRVADAPTVIGEWKLRADAGRLLVPRGGNAALVRSPLTESGFEWITQRGALGTAGLLGLLALAAWLLRMPGGAVMPAGLLVAALAVAAGGLLASSALSARRVNLREVTVAATMVPPGETITLAAANVAPWRAMIVGWGVIAALAGVGLCIIAGRRGGRLPANLQRVAGVVLVVTGVLAQRGGAVLFFAAASGAAMALVVPPLVRWSRGRRAAAEPPAEPGSATATAVSLLMVTGMSLATLALGSDAHAQSRPAARPNPSARPAAREPSVPSAPSVAALSNQRLPGAPAQALLEGTKPAQAMNQRWSIRDDRLFAEVDLTVRGGPGDSFLLLKAPGVLTDFTSDGLRVGKVERDGEAAYYITPERAGLLVGRMRFEMPVPDRTQPLLLPTGPAAAQRVTIELDQRGWEFLSPMAVQVQPAADDGADRSAATLVLTPHPAPLIRLQPRSRDPAAEATRFQVESAQLFVPGPGVVNGTARFHVRPVQGRVAALEILVPNGLTVGDVNDGPVGAWRFNPGTGQLHIEVEPAQAGAFSFDVETQRGTGELPFGLSLEPLRVAAAAGEVGLLALAFGADAQPEAVRATDVSAVNGQDFDAALLPRTRDGQLLATLQHAWRFGPAAGRVDLRVAAVAPEVRVTTRQVLSLDDDRIVMAVDLGVAITRVGLFKLTFALPAGLEVEAISGTALAQWTEAPERDSRIVTLHLNGRTMGEQTFRLSLAGPAPGAQAAWLYPKILVREATRQVGEVLAVPGKGIRLRAAERERVTPIDPRAAGAMQPGTLAFRVLQDDWMLRLGIEMLEAWVTAQALQEVTVREGQTLTRLALRYRIENAPVKQVRLRLPGLGVDSAGTVRATGSSVTDIVRVADTPDTWEIRFQRGMIGETDVQVEFQGPAVRERGEETIVTPELVGARQSALFVAIRSGGRLELGAGVTPRGWTRVDWSAVPTLLQRRSDPTVPAYAFRVAEPEGSLAVTVRRHEVAAALKLRVTQADLMTIFSPDGPALTAVELKIEVLEKSTLRARLPAGARLFSTFVNGESVAVVREGEDWLFHVAADSANQRAAAVRLVYSAPAARGNDVGLAGPSLSVPLENVTWRVVLPPGHVLDDYRGALRLRDERSGAGFGIQDYAAVVSSRRSAETQQSVSLLRQASALIQRGDQEKAVEALRRVSTANSLDQASNEDARVQLRTLKTQQAILGLNTRRQRLYLDNRGDAARNEQLEQAATLNPFMQGKVNFDPRQVDQLLLGNTAEENTALRGIAARIVEQQLGAGAAPGAIDVTLPERGQVVTFSRSLQVDGNAPLELALDVSSATHARVGPMVVVLFGVAAVALLSFRRTPLEPAVA